MTVKTLIKGLMVSIMCIFTLDLILNDGRDSNGNVICSDSVEIVQLFKNWVGWGENMKNRISWQLLIGVNWT